MKLQHEQINANFFLKQSRNGNDTIYLKERLEKHKNKKPFASWRVDSYRWNDRNKQKIYKTNLLRTEDFRRSIDDESFPLVKLALPRYNLQIQF